MILKLVKSIGLALLGLFIAVLYAAGAYVYIDADGKVFTSEKLLPESADYVLLSAVQAPPKIEKSTSKTRIYLNHDAPLQIENVKVLKRGFDINYVSRYDNLVLDLSARYDIDANLVKAIIRVESAFQADVVSHAGAQGLMQLMPATAKEYGVSDSFDPVQNIGGGIRLLKDLLKKYKYNLSLTLAAYNAGQGAVNRHDGIPPYQETREYVKKVLHFRDIYSTLNN